MKQPVKILIVEDSEDDAKLALRALRTGGFDPTHRRVQTAAELVTALGQERWDAVISDFMMPGFTGMDALGLFRATGLDIPFILVSGTMGEESAVNAMKAGASDYVMKDRLARLAPALERELKEAQMREAHRQAQRDLVQSEQHLRTIIETEPECVKVVSREGVLLEMNAAGLAMLEAGSLAAVQSRTLLEYIVPEYRAAFVALHQRVIRGESGNLEFEVIGLKGGRRWLETHAAPMGGANGEVAMLLGITRDITERKRAEQAQSRLVAIIEATPDMVATGDPNGHVLYYNPAGLRMLGFEPGLDVSTVRIPDTHPEWAAKLVMEEAIPHAIEHGTWSGETALLGRDGREIPVSQVLIAHKGSDGSVEYLSTIARDITLQKEHEKRIMRLNRVYAVLSGINTLIVRVRDRDELFREACRIAVEDGQFQMAWIGVVDRSAMKIVPVAWAGAGAGFLEQVRERLSLLDAAPAGHGPPALAVREKQAVVVNDVEADPRIRNKTAHADRCIRSSVSLPLLIAGEAVGVFCMHAAEAKYFDEAEMKLLTDLTGDIAFAIDHLDKQERLNYLAYYDALTGLANRSLFLERVAQHIRSAVSGGHKLALFLIDLERFKNINDSLGRPAGDALLKQVAEWLTHNAGDVSLVARLDADHFAEVMPEVKHEGDVARLLEKWMAAFLEHPFRLNDAVFRIATKAGVALFPEDGADAETLFRNAEAALKKAKTSGDRYLFHNQKMTEAVAGKLTLENQLRQALDKGEFVLHYQPKVNLASGKLTGAEALIRWNDPRTGLVPPGRFIPILEETGLIYDVGRWALKKAIEDYLRWRAAGLPAVRIAVNVSPLQLRNRGFIGEIEQAIGIDPQAAGGLELEITESLIMQDVKHNIASLQAIRALGVTIAIDDFGTGFSSLSYLAKLPVDTLKIDRSFVVHMTAGPEGLALVSTIINMAHALKLKVVAEGVETDEQSRLLRLVNCDEMQGYLFSKPLPGEIFAARFLAPPRSTLDAA